MLNCRSWPLASSMLLSFSVAAYGYLEVSSSRTRLYVEFLCGLLLVRLFAAFADICRRGFSPVPSSFADTRAPCRAQVTMLRSVESFELRIESEFISKL